MPFRRLVEADREAVMDLLNVHKSGNIGVIGEVKIFGFDSEECTFYGEFVEGELVSVIDHFMTFGVGYYSNGKGNMLEAAALINNLEWKEMGGFKELVLQLAPHISHTKERNILMAETNNYDYFQVDESKVKTTKTEEDLENVINLYALISEFANFMSMGRETILSNYKKMYLTEESGLEAYLTEGEQVIAVAGASLENDEFALLEGVATHPDHRKKGHATTVIKHLMNEYKRKNKKLCLTYSNPEAGALYRKLGFEEKLELLTLIR